MSIPEERKMGQSQRQDLVAVGKEGKESGFWAEVWECSGHRRKDRRAARRGLGHVKPAVSVDIQGKCPAGTCCPLHLQHAWTPQFFRV